MNIDGSVTPVEFKMVVPAGVRYHINRLCLHISDATAFSSTGYGAVPALANGVTLGAYDASDNLLVDLFGGHPLNGNEDYTAVATNPQPLDFGAGSVLNMAVHFHFDEQYGVMLDLEEGEYLKFTVNDDLTGLTDHHIMASGFWQTMAGN